MVLLLPAWWCTELSLSCEVFRVVDDRSEDGFEVSVDPTSEEERLEEPVDLLDTHRATMLASLLFGVFLSGV